MKRTAVGLATALVIVALSATSAALAAAQSATTLPATTTATTAATTTPATTAPATTTTRPPRTTTTAAATSTSSATSTTVTTTTSSTSSSSVSGSRIAAIVIIVVVGLALIAGLYFLIARNRQRSHWASAAHVAAGDAGALATAVERGLPLLRNPNTAAQVWVDLNNRAGRVRSGLNSLSPLAPDQRANAATARARQALDALAAAIDADRGVRMGPPAPSDDQLAYSEALLSQRAVELGRAAQDIESLVPPA